MTTDHYTPMPMPVHVCSCGQPNCAAAVQHYMPQQPTVIYQQAPAPAPAQPSQVGKYLAVGAGAAAVLVPVVLAITAALLAAAVTGLAVAVVTVFLRWVIRDMQKGR